MIEFTKRELSVLDFALWRMIHDALSLADAAGQDKTGTRFKEGAVVAFHKDARDATELRIKLKQIIPIDVPINQTGTI